MPVAIKISPHWRKSAYCRYYQIKGHSIEGCFAFKEIVQQFIDRGESFTKDDIPPSNPRDNFINGVWDSDDEDVYLQDLTENIWEEDTPIDAVLTRSGRVQP